MALLISVVCKGYTVVIQFCRMMIQPELFTCREKPSVTILSKATYTPDRDINTDMVVKTKILLPAPPPPPHPKIKTDSPTHHLLTMLTNLGKQK
jgi:hypothetical protein